MVCRTGGRDTKDVKRDGSGGQLAGVWIVCKVMKDGVPRTVTSAVSSDGQGVHMRDSYEGQCGGRCEGRCEGWCA